MGYSPQFAAGERNFQHTAIPAAQRTRPFSASTIGRKSIQSSGILVTFRTVYCGLERCRKFAGSHATHKPLQPLPVVLLTDRSVLFLCLDHRCAFASANSHCTDPAVYGVFTPIMRTSNASWMAFWALSPFLFSLPKRKILPSSETFLARQRRSGANAAGVMANRSRCRSDADHSSFVERCFQ